MTKNLFDLDLEDIMTPNGQKTTPQQAVMGNVVHKIETQPQPVQSQIVPQVIDVNIALQKIKNIESELKAYFVERDECIKVMMLSLISRMPFFMVGEPGTGKSLLTEELCKHITHGNYFGYLMNKTTDPSEVFGPFSLTAMERDQFLRKTHGYLPEAHIAFIDEIFRGNSPVLNLLLSIINERIFFNDGKRIDVPLITMFASANSYPESEDLNAMYDRFVFRMHIPYLKDNASKQKMLQNRLNANLGIIAQINQTYITIDELHALNAQAKKVTMHKTVVATLLKLTAAVGQLGFKVSDRKLNQCLDILQTHALYSGRNFVSNDDLIALKYVFFDDGINSDDVESEILKLADPYTDEINKYYRQFMELKTDLESKTDLQEKLQTIVQFDKSVNTIISNMSNAIQKAQTGGKDITEFLNKRDEITAYQANLMNMTLGRTTQTTPVTKP